ncbi:MAG: HPF/RaiA family ribosome-associated protein [Myxococcales bacterium]|nr:HPF/RaiA family ribosome-associated protein [Myxococcales bacterium]
MHIQINTDHNIEGRENLADHVRGVVEHALRRFTRQITRVEVHLSAQAGGKSGPDNGQDDKRCMMEVRIEGRQPTAVTHQAASVDAAINGAAEKLEKAIERVLERLHAHH